MNMKRVDDYFERWPDVFYGTYEDEQDPDGDEKLAFILASTVEEQKEIFRRMGASDEALKVMFP